MDKSSEKLEQIKLELIKGDEFYFQKKYEAAIQHYEVAISLDPNCKEGWHNKGYSLFQIGKYLESLECFDAVLKIDPKYKESWYGKGNSLHKLERYSDCVYCYEEASKLGFSSANLWRNKGNSLIKLEKYDNALQDLSKALELEFKDKEALNDKGRIFKKRGDFDLATKYFRDALRFDARYEDAKINIERINKLRNSSQKQYFDQCLEDLKSNKIDKLDLGDLNIGKSECQELCEVLKLNYSIQTLNLEDNKIGNEELKLLCETLKTNYSIQNIKLRYNFIDDVNLQNELKTKLEENRKLSFMKIANLEVDWNEITSNASQIKTLILNNCKLQELPTEINALEELINLDLRDNELKEIPNLSRLNKLVSLNLSKNQIELNENDNNLFDEICSKLPKSIKYFIINENDDPKIGPFSQFEIILQRDLLDKDLEAMSKIYFWIFFDNKINVSIEKLNETTKNLKELNILDLSAYNLSTIPPITSISTLEPLCTKLVLMKNKLEKLPESILPLTKLRSMKLGNNNLSSIPETITKLKNLKEISLEKNQFIEFPFSLAKHMTIESIWMDENKISNIPKGYKFVNLERLSLCENKLTTFDGIVQWKALKVLILNENSIETIPKEINNLKGLKKICLNHNKIKLIPSEIGELEELIELQMKNNLIEEIPLEIGKLIQLETIDFSYNQIKYIPASIGSLNKLIFFNVRGNPLVSPPLEISNNLNDLKGYWNDLLVGAERCNYLKLIIVGEENVGKTTLVRTLIVHNNSPIIKKKVNVKREFKNKPLSTDGIDISVQPLSLNVDRSHLLPNNQLNFNIWDFGGQEVYHSTHIFFLSPNSIYLIVWNMSKKEEINRLIYWIRTIQSYIKNAMIILVGTHLDRIENIKSNPKIVDDICENVSMQSNIPTEFIIGVSCKNGTNYDKLFQLIKERALNDSDETDLPSNEEKKLKSLAGAIFPKMYFELKTIIEEEGRNRIQNNLPPILTLKEFKLIARKSNIVREEELKRGLSFLHSLGFCLYFAKDQTLNKYVILNSQWLANTMATLITTKSKFIQMGLIDHKHFKQVWREPLYPPQIHPILFELLQKFYVIIPITHDINGDIYIGKSVVPALLSNETKPNNLFNTWNEGRKIEIQRIYEFTSFLPTQLFPQFIATIFSLFGTWNTEYWRDGILIKRQNIKCLIELDSINKLIIISFVGNKFISLFKQIQLRLDMILNKWDNINLEVYITCPFCCSSLNSNSNRNKCFKLKDCFEKISNQTEFVICKFAQNNVITSIKTLMPELDISQINKIIEWNEIEIENKIGEGGFAEVFKGKYENSIVAIKKLKIIEKLGEKEIEITEEHMRRFLLEIGFLSYGNHENLLQYIGIVLSPPSIILPFAHYGSLFKLLYETKKVELNSSIKLMLRISLDIISGLNYLHSLNPPIIHCDLKSENVLIMSIDYEDNVVCKITDFGLSQFSVGKFLVHTEVNPIWCAPEVLQQKDQSIYSDIYSFGMVLYEILTKKLPYSEEENSEWKFMSNVQKAVIEGTRPSYSKEEINVAFKTEVPNQLFGLMEACWNHNPMNRPNSQKVFVTIYSSLSTYWKEISETIPSPLSSLPNLNNENFIEFKNERAIQKLQQIYQGMYYTISLCAITNLAEIRKYVMKEMRTDIPKEKEDKVKKLFLLELDAYQKINSVGYHTNLVQSIGYHLNLKENKLFLILEYCNGGSLENYIDNSLSLPKTKSKKVFRLEQLKKLFKDILLGLAFLHKNKFAHLDLKPENILIRRNNKQILNLCLSNFGMGKLKLKFELEPQEETTYNYMAPEVFKFYKENAVSDQEHTYSYDETKADMWSLGFVLFRMLGETFPYNGPFKESLLLVVNTNLETLQLFPSIYFSCTERDPKKRPSAQQLLDNHF